MKREAGMGASQYQIALLKGDGIGPEVVDAARTVLERASLVHGITLHYQDFVAGAVHYQRTGESISAASMGPSSFRVEID
jgi:3-isopropylmalate dehydrogenase